jgi:hypothetical protein
MWSHSNTAVLAIDTVHLWILARTDVQQILIEL